MEISNIQMIKNFYFMVDKDPDFIKTKPRLMATIQNNRCDKITMILIKLYEL